MGVGVVTDIVADDKADFTTDQAQSIEAQVLAFDRRRAGRLPVSPALVPLLRDPASVTTDPDQPLLVPETSYRGFVEADPFHNEMAPSRGIMLGLSISMLFWGAIGYTIFR
jgi:hypothetical protein